jgi:hypothetical protein
MTRHYSRDPHTLEGLLNLAQRCEISPLMFHRAVKQLDRAEWTDADYATAWEALRIAHNAVLGDQFGMRIAITLINHSWHREFVDHHARRACEGNAA